MKLEQVEIFKSVTRLVDILMDVEDKDLMEFGDIPFEVLRSNGKVRPKVLERDWTTADCINILSDLEAYLKAKLASPQSAGKV